MLIVANGDEIEVSSARAALERFGPHDEVSLVHRRADGAVLRAVGSPVRGFVIEVTGGHTGTRTSSSRSLKASTIATMFDRFAVGDTGWPGPVVWQDETDAAPVRRRKNPVWGVVATLSSLVIAIVAVALLRRTVTVPWVCGRDGAEVTDVRIGGRGVATTADCVFVDGRVIGMLDVDVTFGWAEVIVTTVAVVVLWYLIARIVARLVGR